MAYGDVVNGLEEEGATEDTIALVRKIWEGDPAQRTEEDNYDGHHTHRRDEESHDDDTTTTNERGDTNSDDDGEQPKPNNSPSTDQVRNKKIQLLVRFFEHAATCDSATCPSTQCIKMKRLFRHSQGCKTKMNGGCDRCKTVWYLSTHHARNCTSSTCCIPLCVSLRQPIRISSLIDRMREEGTDNAAISEVRKCCYGGTSTASSTTTTTNDIKRVDTPADRAIADQIGKSQATTTTASDDNPLIRRAVIDLVSRKPTVLEHLLHRDAVAAAPNNTPCGGSSGHASGSTSTSPTNSGSISTATTSSTSGVFRIYHHHQDNSASSGSRRRRRRVPPPPPMAPQHVQQQHRHCGGGGTMASDNNHAVLVRDDKHSTATWGEGYDSGCMQYPQEEEHCPHIYQQMQSA